MHFDTRDPMHIAPSLFSKQQENLESKLCGLIAQWHMRAWLKSPTLLQSKETDGSKVSENKHSGKSVHLTPSVTFNDRRGSMKRVATATTDVVSQASQDVTSYTAGSVDGEDNNEAQVNTLQTNCLSKVPVTIIVNLSTIILGP